MEHIKYQHGDTVPQYIFEGSYVLRCTEDCVLLIDVASNYADPSIQRPPFTGASTRIRVLSAPYLTMLLLETGLPVRVRFEGAELGRTSQFNGRYAADTGTFSRRIRHIELSASISIAGACFGIVVQADPVLPETVYSMADMRSLDKETMRRQFTMEIPHDAVPDILDFDHEERGGYMAICRELRNSHEA